MQPTGSKTPSAGVQNKYEQIEFQGLRKSGQMHKVRLSQKGKASQCVVCDAIRGYGAFGRIRTDDLFLHGSC
jgi:hypothetical protein